MSPKQSGQNVTQLVRAKRLRAECHPTVQIGVNEEICRFQCVLAKYLSPILYSFLSDNHHFKFQFLCLFTIYIEGALQWGISLLGFRFFVFVLDVIFFQLLWGEDPMDFCEVLILQKKRNLRNSSGAKNKKLFWGSILTVTCRVRIWKQTQYNCTLSVKYTGRLLLCLAALSWSWE